MKKIAAVALLTLGAVLAGCSKQEPAAPAATPAPAAVTKIVVGLDDNFPPMGFRNEKNELIGFDIDMAKEAAKRLGLEVEFKPIDWGPKEAELSGKRGGALWNGLAITEAIIAMAKKLSLSVVAEGVETADQRDFLARCGSELIQGYFYSPPLAAEALPAFCRTFDNDAPPVTLA